VIYLDSNVFIYAVLNQGEPGTWCRDLLKGVVKGDTPALTSVLAVDEVVYQVREARGLEPSVETGETLLQTPNLEVAAADTAVLWRALDLSRAHRMFPRDAIHAATALLRGVPEIASEDADFDGIPGLRRRWRR